MYSINGNSNNEPKAAAPASAETTLVKADETTIKSGNLLLFKTPTCPNCKAAMKALDEAGIAYKVVDAYENLDLVDKYDIQAAPTLIVESNNGFSSYHGVGDIRSFIASQH